MPENHRRALGHRDRPDEESRVGEALSLALEERLGLAAELRGIRVEYVQAS